MKGPPPNGLVPFRPEHFDDMKLRDPGAVNGYGPGYRELMARYPEMGPAWTLLRDERPVFSGGIVILWNGVGEAWTLMSERVREYPLAVVKTIRFCIDEAVRSYQLRRVQATVKKHDDRAIALLHAVGFKIEGLMEQYGPDGEDYYMVRRLIPWKS